MEVTVKSGMVDLNLNLDLDLSLLLPDCAPSSTGLALASDPTTLTAHILERNFLPNSLRSHQVLAACKLAAAIENPSVRCQRVLEAMAVPHLALSDLWKA